MRKNRKKKAKEQKTFSDPRDKRTEWFIYVILILLMIFGLATAYMMSQEFKGMELQENGHFKKIEIEK